MRELGCVLLLLEYVLGKNRMDVCDDDVVMSAMDSMNRLFTSLESPVRQVMYNIHSAL